MDVLVAAAGAAWEPDVLRTVESDLALVLLRRCVDVADLLVAADGRPGAVALVDQDLPGLDADVVWRLQQEGVHVVAVEAEPERVGPLGIVRVVARQDVTRLGDDLLEPPPGRPAADGRVVAVWGPVGSPGRSTVALGLAAELAAAGTSTAVVDADPFGGTLAQSLGVLDEVSGLLAAARASNAGEPDAVARHAVRVADRLVLLTGLPRADMWPHVRAGAYELVLAQCRALAEVTVVDAGFCLEDGGSFDRGGPRRHQLTRLSLEAADEVVVVAAADPVGLSRLVRAVAELGETVPGARLRLVVNGARASLGWSQDEMARTLERLTGLAPDHVLPYDRTALDTALMHGATLRERASGSPLTAALGTLARDVRRTLADQPVGA
jgi:Flp pilus assembly CpaE family ATPase